MGLPQAQSAFADEDRGSVHDDTCCTKHSDEWMAFLRRLDLVPEHELLAETERFTPPKPTRDQIRARQEADVARAATAYRARQRAEQRKLAEIRRKRVAALVTEQQVETALRYLERKQA